VAASNKPEAVRIPLFGGFRMSVGQRSMGEDEWRLRNAGSLISACQVFADPARRCDPQNTKLPELTFYAVVANGTRELRFERAKG
jgi:hypothetical protein